MGRVHTKTVKKSSRQVIEKYYSRLTRFPHEQEDPRGSSNHPFEEAPQQDRRILNASHEEDPEGTCAWNSLKPREEERERCMDFVPDESAKTDHFEVDKETLDMLASLGMADLPGVVKVGPVSAALVAGFGRGRRF